MLVSLRWLRMRVPLCLVVAQPRHRQLRDQLKRSHEGALALLGHRELHGPGGVLRVWCEGSALTCGLRGLLRPAQAIEDIVARASSPELPSSIKESLDALSIGPWVQHRAAMVRQGDLLQVALT
eukprot:6183898-Pleurochrysis_carterae.AAC.8